MTDKSLGYPPQHSCVPLISAVGMHAAEQRVSLTHNIAITEINVILMML